MRGEAVNMPNAQKLAKAAHSLSAEALGLDEFETLAREKAYLADAFGVPVEIFSADEAGEDQGQEPPGGAWEAGNIYQV